MHGKQVDLEEFIGCLERLEQTDVIDLLTFRTAGESPTVNTAVLLDPTRVDAYASALLVAAKDEPDGPGHLEEGRVLKGEFKLEAKERMTNSKAEKLVLWYVLESLFRRDLALREKIKGLDYLVFPAQCTTEQMQSDAEAGRQRTTASWIIKSKEEQGKYDVFLSHNSKDKKEVEMLAKRLKAVGIRPWLDKWDLVPGSTIGDALEVAIKSIPCAILFFGKADTCSVPVHSVLKKNTSDAMRDEGCNCQPEGTQKKRTLIHCPAKGSNFYYATAGSYIETNLRPRLKIERFP